LAKKKKKGKKKRRYEMLMVHTTYALNPHPLKHWVLVCWCFGGSARVHPLKHRFWWRLCKKEERERDREKRELQDFSSFSPSLLLRFS
jgi:hypothetical protein